MSLFKRISILVLSSFIFQATGVLASDIDCSLNLSVPEEECNEDSLLDLLYKALTEFNLFNESFMEFLSQEELTSYGRNVAEVTLNLRLSKKREFIEKLNSLLKFAHGKILEKIGVLSVSDEKIEILLQRERNIKELLNKFEEKKKRKASLKSQRFTLWQEHVNKPQQN